MHIDILSFVKYREPL